MKETIIPVVDFKKLSEKEEDEYKKLREACEKPGCFRVINHTIPLTLMAEMKLVAKQLHDLPKETRMRNKSKSNVPDSGYISREAVGPLYEALGIYDMHASPDALQDFVNQLNVSPHQRQIIETYGHAIHDLASNVSQKMAESLGIENIDFKDWPFIFRILKYNFTQEAIDTPGMLLHSDTGFITLLQDDDTVEGLEYLDNSNSFKTVPPIPGSFLCNVGDVGHAWSNGRFRNVKHRVICKEASTRYSFGAFMLSSRDGNVEAPAKLVDPSNTRLYHPFNYADFRELRTSTEKRAGEILNKFRIGHDQ